MRKIGVTGGIGSGKTEVCKRIQRMGYPVYYADTEAKRLMEESETLKKDLLQLFGDESFIENKLNRPFLRQQIFENTDLLEKMNALVHPVVRKDFHEWTERQTSLLVFQESALLFETKAAMLFDSCILVTAPISLRIKRVMKRDICSEEEVIIRMNKQLLDSEKITLADFVIQNDETSDLDLQIKNVIQKLNHSTSS